MFNGTVKLDSRIGDYLLNTFFSIITGQSYDGAWSMRGQYSGLRALVQKENPKALYVWCHAHVLNLVIIDMRICAQVRKCGITW